AAMDRAFGSAVDHREEAAPPLIRGGDDDLRIAGIEDDVGDAGVLGDLQHLRPGSAAVSRFVEPAIAAGSPERALRGHVDGVAVLRADHDAADVLGRLQSDIGPRAAAVVALVDAV